jgi:hypothetical protein
MTCYLATRPAALPPLPALDLRRVDRPMQEAAAAFLAQCKGLGAHLADTLATGRPGLAQQDMMTDDEFAQLVLDTPLQLALALGPLAGGLAGDLAADMDTATPDLGAVAGAAPAYAVGKLRIGRGQAVMNNQILRSSAFSGPTLDTALPVLADKSSYSVELYGVSPRADHLDVLLFAVSLVDRAPDPKAGIEVTFTSHKFLSTLGWAINSSGYERLVQTIRDLKRIEFQYHDRSRPKDGRIRVDNFFSSLDMPDRDNKEQIWRVTLPAALFRIYDLRRNAVIELQARAAIRSDFGRWLHGFISTQQVGKSRVYDAEAVCRAGGLHCARLADDLKYLRSTMAILIAGELTYRGKQRRFKPVLSEDSRVAFDPASGRYLLHATRVGDSELLTEGAAD